MKRKLLAWALSACMILSMIPAVGAAETTIPAPQQACPEDHTTDSNWKSLNETLATLTASGGYYTIPEGHYYLTDNLDFSKGSLVFKSDATLCLNGYQITGTPAYTYAVQLNAAKRLDICDCKGTGKISVDEGTGKKYVFAADGGGTFNMYGGTVENCTVRTCVNVQGGATFNMYGGSFLNNNVNMAVLRAQGGTVNVAGQDATISGNYTGLGTLRTGSNASSVITVSAGTIDPTSNTVIYGEAGSISVTGGSLKGAITVKSGTTPTITISGGKFNNTSIANYLADGFRIRTSDDSDYPYEVEICDHAETVILPSKDATCTEAGLTEGVQCSLCGTVTLEQVEIPVAEHTLTTVPAQEPTYEAAGWTEHRKCTNCDYTEGYVELLPPQQPCPTDHTTDSNWKSLNETLATLTTSGGYYTIPEGHYYLTADIDVTNGSLVFKSDATLCLNGYQITGTPAYTYAVQLNAAKRLDICDCKGTGKISVDEGTGKKYVFAADGGGTFNMYGGTVENCTVRTCVNVQGGATFNMYGGSFLNNNVNMAVLRAQGGTVNVAGRNATISGNYTGLGTLRTGSNTSSVITVSAGTIDPTEGNVIYGEAGSIFVTGGSLKGAITVKSGSTPVITISGGKFNKTTIANYVAEGYRFRSTGNDDYPYEVVENCDHTETEILPGKDATYNTTGLTEGTICSVCGEVLIEQEIIPALTGAIAQVCGIKYATLNEAISAANVGDTVLLLEDLEVTAPVTIAKNIMLDLGGKTISRTSNDSNSAVLFIPEGSCAIVSNGALTITGNGIAAWVNGDLSLHNVDVSGADMGIYANNANVTAFLGSITATTVTASYSGDGIRAYGESCVTIANAVVSGSASGSAVEVYQNSNVSVDDITTQGTYSAIVYGGTLLLLGTAEKQIAISANAPEGYCSQGSVFASADAVAEEIVIETVDGTVEGPEGLNVTTTLEHSKVIYDGRFYTVCAVTCNHPEEQLTTIPGKDATCTEAGYTESKVCSCGEIIVEAKEIPASHKLITVPAQEPTYDSVGWNEYQKCENCDYTEDYEEIPALVKPELYTITVDAEVINGTLTVDPTEGVAGTTVTVTATPDEGYELDAITVNGVAIEGNTFSIAAGKNVVGATFKAIPCDHTEDKLTTVPGKDATCTEAGYTESKVCECGETVVEAKEIPAGHKLTTVPAQEPTYEAAGWNEYKKCENCDYTEGYVEIPALEKPIPTGTLADNGRSLSLEGEVFVNQYVQVAGFEGLDQAYLEENGGLMVWTAPVTDAELAEGTAPAPAYISEGMVYNGLYKGLPEYMVRTNGIAAKSYADVLYFCAYVEVADGVYAYSPVYSYSVQTYCNNQLNKATAKETLKATCAALLHFGAAAQVNFNYNVDTLANDVNVVPGIANYPAAEWDAGLITALDEFTTELVAEADVKDNGKSLSLEGEILVNYYTKVSNIQVAKAEMLFWYDNDETLTEANVDEVKEMTLSGSEYHVQSNGVPAKEYGKTIFACAKITDAEGNVHYGTTVAYSVEYYANNQITKNQKPNLVEACKRMVIYGETAAAHFNK